MLFACIFYGNRGKGQQRGQLQRLYYPISINRQYEVLQAQKKTFNFFADQCIIQLFFLILTCIIFIQFFLKLMDQQNSGSVMQQIQTDIKKHLENVSYVSNLSRKLEQQKKTIILLHDQSLKDSQIKVKLIAYFLMGFPYQQSSDKGLKFQFNDKTAQQDYFPIYNVKVGVMENDKNLRVIYFQFSSKELPIGEIAFAISIIDKMTQSSSKIYLLADEYDEDRKPLDELITLFNIDTKIKKDLSQICFGDNQDIKNPNDLILSKRKGEYKLPNQYDIFAEHNVKDLNIKFLLKCLQDKKYKYNELANLVTYRTEIQALCLNMISAITFMMNCAVNNKQSQISNQLQLVLNELKILLLTGQNEKIKVDDKVKYHPKLAYKYLVLDIIQFINTNQKRIQNLGREPQARISWLKNYFTELIQKIRVLPVVNQKNLMLFEQLGLFFTSQLDMLSKIQCQNLHPQIQIFLRELYIRGGQSRERVQDNTVKIKLFGLIVDLSIEQKMGLKYYTDFDKLIDNCSKDLQLRNLPNKQALTSKKNNLKQKLPLIKLKAALDSKGSNKDEIKLQIQCIAEFFMTIFNNLKSKKNLDWKQLINLFNKGGHILKKNGFPQLAIQFFKKIRFENDVQGCVTDVILKNGLHQEKKSEFYMQICKYFELNDQIEKARQYAQKAYESYPNNINYLKKQRQLTKRMHSCHVDKTFLASVGSFNADNLDNFYNYELKQSLKKQLLQAGQQFQRLESTFDLSIQNFNFNFEKMDI